MSRGGNGQEEVAKEGAPDRVVSEAPGKNPSFYSVTGRHWKILDKVMMGSDLCF